jgi:hypothetical protein
VRRFGVREIPLERRQGCEQKTLRTPAHLVGKPNEDHSRPRKRKGQKACMTTFRESCLQGETAFVEPEFPPAFWPLVAACL